MGDICWILQSEKLKAWVYVATPFIVVHFNAVILKSDSAVFEKSQSIKIVSSSNYPHVLPIILVFPNVGEVGL